MKNELGGSATLSTQQNLRGWGWGLQWNEQENWGVKPSPTPVNSNQLLYKFESFKKQLKTFLYLGADSS